MTFILCWVHNQKIKKKKYKNLDDIIDEMSNCLWSGEWIETTKGEKIEMDWNKICYENFTLF